jgi:hypothetical protein
MADSKISNLTVALLLNNSDEFAVVQSGTTKKVTWSLVKTVIPNYMPIAIGDETTAITTGTSKYTFRMPASGTLISIRASLAVAGSTSGTTTIDINKNGVSIFSTLLTIDSTEKTSETAATPAAIGTATFLDDDEFTVDVDAITAGATEAGLKLWFETFLI